MALAREIGLSQIKTECPACHGITSTRLDRIGYFTFINCAHCGKLHGRARDVAALLISDMLGNPRTP